MVVQKIGIFKWSKVARKGLGYTQTGTHYYPYLEVGKINLIIIKAMFGL